MVTRTIGRLLTIDGDSVDDAGRDRQPVSTSAAAHRRIDTRTLDIGLVSFTDLALGIWDSGAGMRSTIAWTGAALLIAVSAAAQPSPVFTAEDMLAVRAFAGGQPIAVAPTGNSPGNWIAYVLTDQS